MLPPHFASVSGGKLPLTLRLLAHDLSFVDIQSHIALSPDETIVIDEQAEKEARAQLQQDAEAFGCSLTNARVSRLGDLKIVRMDMFDRERRETVGLAVCIEQSGVLHLGIYISGPSEG
jgi:hypothetical protein